MYRLNLSLLGSFAATLDERPLTQFRTNKVQALLVYLALEAPTIHRRDFLMELLWPGLPQKSAQVNLRQTTYQLKKTIPDIKNEITEPIPFILSERQTIQLNPQFPITSDITQFAKLLKQVHQHTHEDLLSCHQCRDLLEDALSLYKGDFLADFSLYDSNNYETWAATKREGLRRQCLDTLNILTVIYIEEASYQNAETTARQQLQMDHLREDGYQHLMKILALTGRRNEALALYQECAQRLQTELGMAPAVKTTALYEQIRTGDISIVTPPQKGIRGYDLQEELGQGAFGTVFCAKQKGIGREVAVKIIQPQYANRPDFIRRFEVEAQIVARLEHPYIVPLYDYWREPDAAYLVMRWLRGGSLQEALQKRPYSATNTNRILSQIAEALTTAHRQNIVHRDIKPSNILLDEEGNGYLSDFGIAKDFNHDEGLTLPNQQLGSPAYISPEQLLGETVSPATDIYSLGLVLYELLTGARPFSTTSIAELIQKQINEPLPLVHPQRPDLPSKVDEIIQRATSKKASERYATPLELAYAFQRLVPSNGRIIAATPLKPTVEIPDSEISNPYKGLRAFQETDASNFYGRSALIQQLLARLANSKVSNNHYLSNPPDFGDSRGWEGSHFLAIVGPSGSGKSSVVKAGLLPALRNNALDGSKNWFIVEMIPSTHPLEELEAALFHVAVNPPPSLLEPLQKDERGLVRTLKRILPQQTNQDDATHLLLVIDQFEELFTLVADEAERKQFIDLLLAALNEPRLHFHMLVTLRADFYDRPLQYAQLGQLLKQNTEIILPLAPNEIEEAIITPAKQMGVQCASGLVSAVIADVNEQPGALPLMQYALTELFENRNGRLMTLETYQEIGGVTGALAKRADEIYDGLPLAAQEATRQLFLRLVTLGEGVEDTRRRVRQTELTQLGDNVEQGIGNSQQLTEQITNDFHPSSLILHNLEIYGRYRLLTFDHDPITREPTVEVAHEALIREWQRLQDWLREGRDDIRLQRTLATATKEWLNAQRDNGYLLRGSRLDLYQNWVNDTHIALTQDEQAFLYASISARKEREKEEEARHQRELETAKQLAETERRRAQEQKKSAQTLRKRAVYLGAALVVAAILAFVAVYASLQATDNAETAVANAHNAATQEALAAARAEEALESARSAATAEAVAQQNELIAVAAQETAQAETFVRATSEANALQQQAAAEQQRQLAVSRELSQVATTVLETDPELSMLLALKAISTTYTKQAEEALHNALQLSRTLMTLSAEDTDLLHAVYTPDGSKLVIQANETIELWDAVTGERLTSVPFLGKISWRQFNEAGDEIWFIVTEDDNNGLCLVSWDMISPEVKELQTLAVELPPFMEKVLSPDGTLLAVGNTNNEAELWDVITGERIFVLEQYSDHAWDYDFNEDGSQLIVGSRDGVVDVFDISRSLATNTPQKSSTIIRTVDGVISQAHFTPSGEQLFLEFNNDLPTEIWDISVPAAPQLVRTFSDARSLGAFNRDGSLVLNGDGNRVTAWDMADETEYFTLAWHGLGINSFSFNPDEDKIVTASNDGMVRIWDAALWGGGESQTGFFPGGGFSFEISPDQRLIGLGSFGGNAYLIDRESLTVVHELTGDEGAVYETAFHPDSSRVATVGGDNVIRIWDVNSGEVLLSWAGHLTGTLAGGFFPGVLDVAYSPDGTRLATASSDGTAKIWDAESGAELLVLAGHTGPLHSIAYSSDGSMIATGSDEPENTVRVWDATTGEEIYTLPTDRRVNGVTFSPDSGLLAATGSGGYVKVWEIQTGTEQFYFPSQGSISSESVLFTPDSKQLITYGNNVTRLWDLATGEEIKQIANNAHLFSMAMTADGRTLYGSSSAHSIVRAYTIRTEDTIALAQSRVTRELTDAECKEYLHVDECP